MIREAHLQLIKQYDHEYYDLDNPSISDLEYDKLRKDYINLYGSKDLNYTPGNVKADFEKFKHPTPVVSLDKWTKDVDDKKVFIKKCNEFWPVEIQPKYDGLTVVVYPNSDGTGKFVTRGGGDVGELLPNFIPQYEGKVYLGEKFPIRGEVFISPENFITLNKRLEAAGEKLMKNPRNAAAGLLRRKERSTNLDLLSFITYDIPGSEMTPEEMRQYIKENTVFHFTKGYTFDKDTIYDDIWGLYDKIKNEYPIDGLVMKSCQENSLTKFGSTQHHPNNALAIKPSKVTYRTVIKDVIWTNGRKKVTPVAIVEPVEIDGTTVCKASLHNMDMIKKLGIKIGAEVEIYKANEIIPQIDRVIKNGYKEIEIPLCPSCGHVLENINGQQFCTNPKCKEKICQNMAFLGQKNVLNIEGLSNETARKIVEKFGCKNQNDIFDLDEDDLMTLPGFAEKSAKKLFNNIQNSRQTTFIKFIKACCCDGIGENVGKILYERYNGLDNFRNAIFKQSKIKVETELSELKGLGQVAIKKLMSNEFWDAVDHLAHYIEIIEEKKNEGKFAGQVFVLTGKMEHPRSYYIDLIERNGAKEGKSVSNSTNYLVIADINSTSSKAKKARELGTVLISPEQLEEMMR